MRGQTSKFLASFAVAAFFSGGVVLADTLKSLVAEINSLTAEIYRGQSEFDRANAASGAATSSYKRCVVDHQNLVSSTPARDRRSLPPMNCSGRDATEKLNELQAIHARLNIQYARHQELVDQVATVQAEERQRKADRQNQEDDAKAKRTQAAEQTAKKRDRVISGNWAASCSERGDRIVCQRYGGFLDNVFPSGCEANNLLICTGRSLCSLAGEIAIVENGNFRKLQAGIDRCPNNVRSPA